MTRDEQHKAAAPRVPPDTCPTIDRTSVLLDSVSSDLKVLADTAEADGRKRVPGGRAELARDVVETVLDAGQNLASARLRLEELRADNEALRESGRYWREVARRLADELDKADKRAREESDR